MSSNSIINVKAGLWLHAGLEISSHVQDEVLKVSKIKKLQRQTCSPQMPSVRWKFLREKKPTKVNGNVSLRKGESADYLNNHESTSWETFESFYVFPSVFNSVEGEKGAIRIKPEAFFFSGDASR